ncbi:MAG TPA: diphthine--ammonia ligase [Flavobacterium sp.]|jgi:uncharacterized protein (TIGR00290 family)
MDFATSWSGGKDSCYAMIKAIEQGFVPKVILNMMNENGKVSRSHGLPLSILHQQAEKMNLPLETVPATWANYEEKFIAILKELKEYYPIDTVVFGDIDLQAHKDWEDKVCATAGLRSVLPLWQQDRLVLVNEMMDYGIVTMIVSCNTAMGEGYLGQLLTKDVVLELHQKGIDPCGENGEFHTMVINCPLFSEAIALPPYQKKVYNDYCFMVWEE